jgi:hypothetical protein
MLRAVRLLCAVALVVACGPLIANSGDWVLHRTNADPLPAGSGVGWLDPELEAEIQGASATVSGYDSENQWYYHNAFHNEWNPQNGHYAYGDGSAIASVGPDDVHDTFSFAEGGFLLELNAGDAVGTTNSSNEVDWEVVQVSPLGTFSLTLAVSVSFTGASSGIASVEDGGGASALAWIGDWQDAFQSGQYVAAGYTFEGHIAWTYDPENGYLETETTPNQSTSYTWTGLSGDGQTVHFITGTDVGFAVTSPVTPFTLEVAATAQCDATITPE